MLEVPLFAPVAAGVARRLGGDGALGGQFRQQRRGQIDEPFVLDISRRGDHHFFGAVMVSQIGHDGLAAEPADDLRAPQHRPAHRLVGKGAFLEIIEDDVVRRVVRLADFLQDHGALAFELLRVEGGVLQDVGENIERERHVLLQHLGVISRALARGIGVEVAAHRLDLLGDGPRAAPLGALERHVLEKMGDAVDLGRLVPRPDIDPDAERNRVDRIDAVGGDPQPARQRGKPHCHAKAPTRRA